MERTIAYCPKCHLQLSLLAKGIGICTTCGFKFLKDEQVSEELAKSILQTQKLKPPLDNGNH